MGIINTISLFLNKEYREYKELSSWSRSTLLKDPDTGESSDTTSLNSGNIDETFDEQKDRLESARDMLKHNPILRAQLQRTIENLFSDNFKITSIVSDVQEVIDNFIQGRSNKFFITVVEWIDRFLLESEVFFTFSIAWNNAQVTVRDIDPIEVTDIIGAPYDSVKTPLWYKVERNVKKYIDGAWIDNMETTYYPSLEIFWDIYDKDESKLNDPELLMHKYKDYISIPEEQKHQPAMGIKPDVFIYHWKYPTLPNRSRGLAPIASSLKWLRHAILMYEWLMDWVKSKTAYAWILKVLPGWWRGLTSAQQEFFKKSPTPGQTRIIPKSIEFGAVNPSTGNMGDNNMERSIRLLSFAASGVPEHGATGDASQANYSSQSGTILSFGKTIGFITYLMKNDAFKEIFGVLFAIHPKTKNEKLFEIKDEYDHAKMVRAIQTLEIAFPIVNPRENTNLGEFCLSMRRIGFSMRTICDMAGLSFSTEIARLKSEKDMGMIPKMPDKNDNYIKDPKTDESDRPRPENAK